MKNANNLKPMFDGFDSNGKLTGNKCILCINQDKKCTYQGFYGEGAFKVCSYDIKKCYLNEK